MEIIYLADFYTQMRMLRETRAFIVNEILAEKPISNEYLHQLDKIEKQLQSILQLDGFYQLKTHDDDPISLELDYELSELKKDRLFLDDGQQGLEDYLSSIHYEFQKELKKAKQFLSNRQFDHFITDRDGTVANYCGRYQSSIQAIYNAIYLTRFAEKIPGKSVILTSAPLCRIGLIEISVQPEDQFVLAGSKGRELQDEKGHQYHYPIDKKQQEKLDELNEAIEELLEKPEFSPFRYIGSGLQYKFGQTTLARQDKNRSIAGSKSLHLKEEVQKLINRTDPKQEHFRLEDTGKDLEIMLTVSKNDQVEDFNKGHGVKFIAQKLKLPMKGKNVLICGDTASDLPMLTAAKEMGAHVTCIFVTTDTELQKEVTRYCEDALIVSSPDVLVSLLYHYAKNLDQ